MGGHAVKDITIYEFCAWILLLGTALIVGCLESRVKSLEWKVEILEIITNSKWNVSSTNRVTITRDPIDNMPMYGVDTNGRLTQ